MNANHDERRFPWLRRTLKLGLAATAVAALTVAFPMRFATAQSTTSILEKLNQLQAALADIATRVTDVASKVTDTSPLATGFAFKPAGYVGGCSVVNVGTTPATVTIRILTIEGSERVSVTQTIQPGQGNGVSQSVVDFSLQHHVWCKFETTAPKGQLRAHLEIDAFATGLPIAILEAK
jgi:hypothetical protein